MKRKLTSCPKDVKPKKSRHMDLKEANQDVTTKKNSKTRQRNVGQQQRTLSWDPDSFCSDSSSSLNSDLDGISKHTHGTKYLLNLKAQKRSCAVLLANNKDVQAEDKDVQGSDSRLKSTAPSRTGKISLAPGSEAEDTLKLLRLNNMSEAERYQHYNSQLDGSVSDESVVSGPSSSPTSYNSLRCRDCERLFLRVSRQGPPKIRKRNHDPALLSCDQWLLRKTWKPQRRQQVRGKLWVHLRRIRERTAARIDAGKENTARPVCSRPHVFLNRNLRRCREMSIIVGGLSKSKVKPWHHRRHRAKPEWPPLNARRRRQIKKKSSEKDSTQDFSYIDLTEVPVENKLPADNNAQLKDLQQHKSISKKQSASDVSGFLDEQGNCRGLEGTRRVLKFESSLSSIPVESHKFRQSLVNKSAEGKMCESHADFTKNPKSLSRFDHVVNEEGMKGFRTPTDLPNVEDKIIRKSRPSSTRGTQKDSFRSMLTALKKTRNQIIKESHS
ncbi:uncharacterized protein si:ch211-227n13.3 isoform X2 [Trichomycterus rosablanca]